MPVLKVKNNEKWECVAGTSGYTIDATLTQSGQAADAKAVGDALAEKQPKGDYLNSSELSNSINTILVQAKESGEFDGADGKSAYQYAVDGGYVGSEDEFAEKLAQETKIHVGPEPPEDGSTLWLDTDELGEAYVPVPTAATVGQYLRVTEVDEDGKVVVTETVDTDTDLLAAGVPADAYVTGKNIRNIGKTLNATEKVSRYMTSSEWMLKIDSVAKTVTVPVGMLACGNWCLPLAEQTVDILQDDDTTLVVYDSSANAVRSVRCTDYTGKTMYVIAMITRDRYTEPNANYVQGPYMVDGVMAGHYSMKQRLQLTEETARIEASFSLDCLYAQIIVPIASADTAAGVEVYQGTTMVGYSWLTNMMDDSSARICAVMAENDRGLVTYGSTIPQNYSGEDGRVESVTTFNRRARVFEASPFTKFVIYGSGGVAFPVGTTVEIWGVS